MSSPEFVSMLCDMFTSLQKTTIENIAEICQGNFNLAVDMLLNIPPEETVTEEITVEKTGTEGVDEQKDGTEEKDVSEEKDTTDEKEVDEKEENKEEETEKEEKEEKKADEEKGKEETEEKKTGEETGKEETEEKKDGEEKEEEKKSGEEKGKEITEEKEETEEKGDDKQTEKGKEKSGDDDEDKKEEEKQTDKGKQKAKETSLDMPLRKSKAMMDLQASFNAQLQERREAMDADWKLAMEFQQMEEQLIQKEKLVQDLADQLVSLDEDQRLAKQKEMVAEWELEDDMLAKAIQMADDLKMAKELEEQFKAESRRNQPPPSTYTPTPTPPSTNLNIQSQGTWPKEPLSKARMQLTQSCMDELDEVDIEEYAEDFFARTGCTAPSIKEAQKVFDSLKTSAVSFKVTSVENVMRPKLAEKFLKKIEEIAEEQGFPANDPRIQPCLGFHGTIPKNVPSIVTKGLLVGGKTDSSSQTVSVVNGAMFGAGVYLGTSALASLYWASHRNSAQPGDNMCMLVCMCVLGRYKLLPGSTQGQTQGYNSHVSPDKEQFILFTSEQVLPCYIINFTYQGQLYMYNLNGQCVSHTGKSAKMPETSQLISNIKSSQERKAMGLPDGKKLTPEEVDDYLTKVGLSESTPEGGNTLVDVPAEEEEYLDLFGVFENNKDWQSSSVKKDEITWTSCGDDSSLFGSLFDDAKCDTGTAGDEGKNKRPFFELFDFHFFLI
eukprot:CAMPEP_0174276652 /NCGR_PEP_ID=MMETSP0439-20130205/60509_1 /TAXON_ID=0 /ORGANISM="Stereomyxa ramosa, Strain Chinc5" /LENGTH=720 /DNA_ID=CAMNT_0015368909 /DNA_START=78 /DNA_END=2240 /DNA_ORIENTATION=+